MTTDQTHIKAITEAVEACFADTDCTVDAIQIKAIVDSAWKAQMNDVMRGIMAAREQ